MPTFFDDCCLPKRNISWQATRNHICVQYYTNKRSVGSRVVFHGCCHRLLHQEFRALSPCLIVQIRFYRNHTQDKRRYVALLASHLDAAGCDVHHALADGGRLIVLTTLGFVHADAIFSWASSSISLHQLVVIFLAVSMWPYHRSRFCRRTGDIGSMLASLL